LAALPLPVLLHQQYLRGLVIHEEVISKVRAVVLRACGVALAPGIQLIGELLQSGRIMPQERCQKKKLEISRRLAQQIAPEWL